MIKFAISILLLATFIITASAQDRAEAQTQPTNLLQTSNLPQGLIPGFYPIHVLMDNPDVLKDLELTEDQAAKWNEVRKKQKATRADHDKRMSAKQKEILEKLKQENINQIDLKEQSEFERQRKQFSTEMANANDKQVLKILDRKQEKRLKEIRLQAEGPKAFEREEVQIALGLVSEQITEIKKINFLGSKQMRQSAALPQGTNPSPAEASDSPNNKAYAKTIKQTQSSMANARVLNMQSIEKQLKKP